MTEQQIRERLADLHKEQLDLLKQLEKFQKPVKRTERKGGSSFLRMAERMVNSKWEAE